MVLGASVLGLGAGPAHALDPVNPVEIDLDGHPANSGFLVFVEDDVTLSSDESEGTIALGGDLRLGSSYQIAAGATPVRDTYTAPGDTRPTYLHVGGGIEWLSPGAQVRVENAGFSKVADDATYTARWLDSNNAQVNYRILEPGAAYEATPFVEGRTRQSPESVATPVPQDLIDIPAAFGLYRSLSTEMGRCARTATLVDDQGLALPDPVPDGARGRLSLVPGQTNVLELSAADLDHLAEITFLDPPTASTPLLVNVTGTSFSGRVPNLAGISGSQAPYVLWNMPEATSVTVTSGDSLQGTIYAPRATLTWAAASNIEGNVIARDFTHANGLGGTPFELHDFPFSTTLSCAAAAAPPRLSLVKEVVNDDGGDAQASDWTLAATGPTNVTGESGTGAVTGVEVAAGEYALSESGGPDGYEARVWTCTGGVAVTDDTITLTDGDDITCTVVNDDVAQSPGPDPTDQPSPTDGPSPTDQPSAAPSSTGSPGGTAPGSQGGVLPSTGAPGPALWLLVAGAGLLALGGALVRRRG